MRCKERLEQLLKERGIAYEIMEHRQAFTMPEVAAALHVPGHQVAKVVMVRAKDELAMLVISSPDRLHLRKVREVLGRRDVRLAKEGEFASRFPDCATGAMPALGSLYGVPTFVDRAVAEQEQIVFRVGTHHHAMRMSYADYANLVRPNVTDLVVREQSATPPLQAKEAGR